jgi:hypothetical protein
MNMRLLKGKVEVVQDASCTNYTYPEFWRQNVEMFPAILYPKTRGSEFMESEKKYQPVFVFVPDELVQEMISECGMEYCSRQEFEEFSDINYPRKKVIDDPQRVMEILSKSALGEELSDEDRDALDPDKAGSGVSWSDTPKNWETKYGVVWE